MKNTEAVVEHRYLFWFTCECGKEYNMEIQEGLDLEVIGYMRATCQCEKEIYFGPVNTWKLKEKVDV